MSDTQPKLAIRTSSTPIATKYEVMFDRDIEQNSEWHEEFYVMRSAEENDVINAHFSSQGGSAATVAMFQNIVKNTKAHVHGILEGVGYSAGSAMFLLCHTQEVADFAEMMIHTSQSSGHYTHSQGREDYGKQTARTAKILVESVYKDFLTDEEITDVLKGAEIWLDANEIRERLTKRDVIREERDREATKDAYDLETYAAQCLPDLIEDCEYLGYDVVDVLSEMKSMVSSSNVVTEDEDQTFDPSITTDLPALKEFALSISIPYPHNIKLETLRKKVLDKLENTLALGD